MLKLAAKAVRLNGDTMVVEAADGRTIECDDVVVAVMDADGRLDPQALDLVAPLVGEGLPPPRRRKPALEHALACGRDLLSIAIAEGLAREASAAGQALRGGM